MAQPCSSRVTPLCTPASSPAACPPICCPAAAGIEALLERAADYESLADVDPLEAKRRESDPLARVELGPLLQQCFQQLGAQQPGLVHGLGGLLTPTQAAALQPVFQQQ
jgi:hypothetical protein